MKKNFVLFGILMILIVSACENKNSTTGKEPTAKEVIASNEDKGLKGSFTADGKSYTGKVSVQNFEATGQYSVLCEDDTDPNNYKLIQFVFKNEAAARAGGKMVTAYDQGKDQNERETAVSFDTRYKSHEDAKGNVMINKVGSNNELVFDDVTLETMSKERVVVSGKIPF